MPVRKVGRSYRIGSGKARYKSRKSAARAYKGYRARKRRRG